MIAALESKTRCATITVLLNLLFHFAFLPNVLLPDHQPRRDATWVASRLVIELDDHTLDVGSIVWDHHGVHVFGIVAENTLHKEAITHLVERVVHVGGP